MSSRNQYKAYNTTLKKEIRQLKTDNEQLTKDLINTSAKAKALRVELERTRLRRWYQFWKFFKRNRIIQ